MSASFIEFLHGAIGSFGWSEIAGGKRLALTRSWLLITKLDLGSLNALTSIYGHWRRSLDFNSTRRHSTVPFQCARTQLHLRNCSLLNQVLEAPIKGHWGRNYLELKRSHYSPTTFLTAWITEYSKMELNSAEAGIGRGGVGGVQSGPTY